MADYTPTLGDYTELKPFRFWCQKVLPLVYDDSLSYYELLCKVVDYLNKTMEDVDTMHDDVVNLHAAYVQLQTYVNTYFDNLDVQEEINNKLDAMAQDGSLSALLAPLIPDLVSDWLEENIEPTTPAIDASLTVQGAGADARVVGRLFSGLSNINSIDDAYMDMLTEKWIVGGLNASGILDTSAKSRITTEDYCEYNYNKHIYFTNPLNVVLCTYTASHTLINRTTQFGQNQIQIPANTIFRLCVWVSDTTINNPYELSKYVVTFNKKSTGEVEYQVKNGVLDQLTTLWVYGGLDTDGHIDKYIDRITTKNYLKFNTSTRIIIDGKTVPIIIVCLYNNSYQLTNRTTYTLESGKNIIDITIPANTFFRLTLTNANITNANCVFKIADERQTVLYSNIVEKMMLEGKKTLPSGFAIFNLYSDGELQFSTNKSRLTFIDYMKNPDEEFLGVANGYNVVLCTYDNSYNLLNRSSYLSPTHAIPIPANTFYRVTVYYDDAISITDPLEYVEKVWLVTNANKDDDNIISIFESFAVIGDSLSCGYVSNGSGQQYSSADARVAGRNWVKYLELDTNRTFVNLSRGSSTVEDWRYGNETLDVDISTADIDTYCYIVALGVNDFRESLTIGTSSDIKTNKSENANSFYGNYDYLIRTLIEYKTARISQAKIFVCTIPSFEIYAETYNAVIRYVAGLYADVYCIDLYRLYFAEFSSGVVGSLYIGGHFRPMAYHIISSIIKKAINKYMIDNYTEFAYTPWPPLT